MRLTINRSFFKRVILGYLASMGVYSVAYVPVLFFTFIGLSQTPYLVETNPTLSEYLQNHGLSMGLLFGYLSSIAIVGLLLGGAHLVFIRPVVFSIGKDLKFARKIVTLLTGLLLLFWGWTFFIDAYNDLQVLSQAAVWNEEALWTVFLVCLGLFFAGLILWGAVMLSATDTSRLDADEVRPRSLPPID